MPTWLLLSLLLGGTALQSKTQTDALARGVRRQRQGRDEEEVVEAKQRQEVLGEAESLDPVLRQEALDLSASNTEDRINAVLADNEVGTTGDVGNVSESLLDRRAQSTRDRANNASILAALMSKTQAPGEVAFDEGQSIMDLLSAARGNTGQLQRIKRKTNTLADIESTPHSGKLMLGGLLSTVGSAGLSSSIMSGLEAPGTGYVGGATASPVPGYTMPDPFGIGAIR